MKIPKIVTSVSSTSKPDVSVSNAFDWILVFRMIKKNLALNIIFVLVAYISKSSYEGLQRHQNWREVASWHECSLRHVAPVIDSEQIINAIIIKNWSFYLHSSWSWRNWLTVCNESWFFLSTQNTQCQVLMIYKPNPVITFRIKGSWINSELGFANLRFNCEHYHMQENSFYLYIWIVFFGRKRLLNY